MSSLAQKHNVCGLVSEIVSSEFINAGKDGAWLHANAIMYDILLKLGIEAELVCGQLTYDGTVQASLHFWIVFDGREYDPTRKMTKAYGALYLPQSDALDLSRFEFHPGREMILCPEDHTMMDTFRQIRRSREYLERYLSEAPSEGRAIRAKINSRIHESVKM